MIHLITKSCAKLNIGLNVYEKGINNKHQIITIMMLIDDFVDNIEIIESNEDEVIYFYNDQKINIPNDTVTQILNFLHTHFHIEQHFKIVINKKIPFNSGLGGSSSNAGAVLRELCDLYKIELSYDDLNYIALYIGSDIPFFVSNYSIALVCNYGDEIYDLSHLSKPKYELIGCKWNMSVKQMYDKFDSLATKTRKNNYKHIIANWNQLSQLEISNDLFIPAILLSKQYHNFYQLNAKKSNDSKILMTGSGSYLFKIIK